LSAYGLSLADIGNDEDCDDTDNDDDTDNGGGACMAKC
jgi:hypothetical protein